MAKQTGINFTDLEANYAGGGTIFTTGLYRVEKSRFTSFDFKTGKDTPCLMWEVQMVDEKGKDVGDVKIQYWPITPQGDPDETIVMLDPVKGEKGCFDKIDVTPDSQYDKIWGGSDFKFFMDKLKPAAIEGGKEWGQLEGLASEFDGWICEMGTVLAPVFEGRPAADSDTKKSNKKDEKKGPRKIVIVTAMPEEGTKPSKKSKKDEVDEDEAPAKSKKGSSKKAEVGDDPDDIVAAFCESELFTKKNEDGINLSNALLNLARYASSDLDKGTDECEAAAAFFKKNLPKLLTKAGWEQDGKLLKKED